MSLAERHEFMIAFDVGHQVEHLIRAVMDVPHHPKNRHFSLRRGILPRDGRKLGKLGTGKQLSDIDLYQLLLKATASGRSCERPPRPALIPTSRAVRN